MNDPSPQSAQRELRRHLGHPATLSALAATGLVLAIVGPFGTDTALSLAERMVYWLPLVALTYAVGALTDLVLSRLLGDRPLTEAVKVAGTAVLVTATVIVLNAIFFGRWPDGATGLAETGTILAVAGIATAGLGLARRHASPENPATDEPSGGDMVQSRPMILDRLPLERRGDLMSLSVEDHYVQVRTTRGSVMVLLRLSDAIREALPVAGLRVHRSHWVATAHVVSVRRDGDRAVLTLTDGTEIPASRSHLPALRAAGLLAR